MKLTPKELWASIPISSKRRSKSITLNKARSVSCTVRTTYAAGAANPASVHIFYSATGSDWDTVPLLEFMVDLTASATIQKTGVIDVPEHGYIMFEVENLDAGEAITNTSLWWKVGNWEDGIQK